MSSVRTRPGKHRKRHILPSDLKEDMKQHWVGAGPNGYYDQFGFTIRRDDDQYLLYWKGEFMVKTHSIGAAKTISTILINDKIISLSIIERP